MDDYISKLKRESAEKMQKLIEKTSCTNITHRVVIRTGIPFIELIDAAEEVQVDIVIMIPGNMKAFLKEHLPEAAIEHRIERVDERCFLEFGYTDEHLLSRMGINRD